MGRIFYFKEEEEEAQFEVHPVVTGMIYKVGDTFVTLYERYFVLNADNGTFIRYRTKSECPKKPRFIFI